MKAQAWLPAAFAVALAAPSAPAQPALRVEVEQKGDFVLIGNTLAHECNNAAPPAIGVVGQCGENTDDTAPDIFWRADSPGPGQAAANDLIAPAEARSSAVLSVPVGATITHAFLYWATTLKAPGQDVNVTLDREGGFATNVAAAPQNGVYQSFKGLFAYHAVADVTPIVQSNGVGSYRVSLVNVEDLRNLNATAGFAGWWMVVFYQDNTASPRHLALFDSFVQISQMNSPESATISDFLVPNGDLSGKLGVVAFGGDASVTGDWISFNGNVLGDPLNPPDNFVNATRSSLGESVSMQGDLPQLTGGPGSMSGMDMDVVDITSMLMPGATSALVDVGSTQDEYFLAGLVTAIPTTLERPDVLTSTESVVEDGYFDYTGCLCGLHRGAGAPIEPWPAAVVMAAAWARRRRRGPRLTGAAL